MTFQEMKGFIIDIIPFGLTMVLMTYIWYEHYLYFVRFGFKNHKVVAMNAMLLFFVLIYVYPLKFLAKLLVLMYTGMFMRLFGMQADNRELGQMIKGSEIPDLMIIYGLGAALIFLVLLWMYYYALQKKEELELNEIELFDTRSSFHVHLIMSSVAIFSILVAVIFHTGIGGGIAGFVYMLYPIIFFIYASKRNKKRKMLRESLGMDS